MRSLDVAAIDDSQSDLFDVFAGTGTVVDALNTTLSF